MPNQLVIHIATIASSLTFYSYLHIFGSNITPVGNIDKVCVATLRNIMSFDILLICLTQRTAIGCLLRVLNMFTGTPDDVIQWKHFPRYWPFVWGFHWSPVNFPHKGQWRGPLMFSLICPWINDGVNNREAGDLRRHRAHYYVIVMFAMMPVMHKFICLQMSWHPTVQSHQEVQQWLQSQAWSFSMFLVCSSTAEPSPHGWF